MSTPDNINNAPTPGTPAGGRSGGRSPGHGLSCQECVNVLMDYLENVLPADQRAVFEAHLTICPNCVTFMNNYQSISKLAAGTGRAISAEPATADVPPQILEAILKACPHRTS